MTDQAPVETTTPPAADESASFISQHLGVTVTAVCGLMGSVAIAVFGYLGTRDDASDPSPAGASAKTSTAPGGRPRTSDELTLGGLYYLFSPSDPVLVQVVDPHRQDTRLEAPDPLHPTAPWDPNANWVDQRGNPVLHPLKPLGPEAFAIAASFGTSENLATYLRENLKPL